MSDTTMRIYGANKIVHIDHLTGRAFFIMPIRKRITHEQNFASLSNACFVSILYFYDSFRICSGRVSE